MGSKDHNLTPPREMLSEDFGLLKDTLVNVFGSKLLHFDRGSGDNVNTRDLSVILSWVEEGGNEPNHVRIVGRVRGECIQA
jgi:hypothetical protein